MLKLRLKDNKHNAVWLVEPKVTIGRAAKSGFLLNRDGVADKHVEISVEGDAHTLKPVDTNLVLLNGKRVGAATTIKAGDIIAIADIALEVIDPKQESSTAKDKAVNTGWALKANHTALANRVFAIKPESIVGRSNDCDITLAAAHLSRRHARLFFKGNLLYVQDLGSANGTYLNGQKVSEARVKRGDELRFDTLSFGVIGPADDLDKTTVRKVSPAAARSANTATKRAAPNKRPAHRPAAVVTTVNDSGGKGSTGLILAILGALFIAIVVFLVVSQSY